MASRDFHPRMHPGSWLAPSLALALLVPGLPARAADSPCLDAGYAQRCAKLCAPWCGDAIYFVEHQDFCLSEPVHRGPPLDTGPDCVPATPVPPAPPVAPALPTAPAPETETPLQAAADGNPKPTPPESPPEGARPSALDGCLVEAQRNARSIQEKLATVASQPALVAELKERLKGVPTCAPDSPTLIRLFRCLEEEGSRIETEFGELAKRGYTALKEIDKLCEISRETMTTDFNSAQDMGARAAYLQETFQRINGCKSEYEKWGAAASAASDKRAAGGLIEAWINRIRSDLEPTAVMAANLDNTIEKITQQTASIIDSVGQGMVICP